MNALLWFLVILGLLEATTVAYYSLVGRVPKRTAAGMVVNGAAMLMIAMWAFWLLTAGAS